MLNTNQYGKDHWSLFAYLEDLCVNGANGVGTIQKNRMRCNGEKHPLLSSGISWKESYSTRLNGFFDFEERSDTCKAVAAGVQIAGHDDWDCLDDLDDTGLIEIISRVNGFVKMTKVGLAMASALREHKANGGAFASFSCAA